jgi:DNA replication protein DnaC
MIKGLDSKVINNKQVLSFDPGHFFEYGKRSTILTSQLPVKQWHDVIGEQTVADAVLDRIVHNAHRVELKGESLRKKWSKKTVEQNEE